MLTVCNVRLDKAEYLLSSHCHTIKNSLTISVKMHLSIYGLYLYAKRSPKVLVYSAPGKSGIQHMHIHQQSLMWDQLRQCTRTVSNFIANFTQSTFRNPRMTRTQVKNNGDPQMQRCVPLDHVV